MKVNLLFEKQEGVWPCNRQTGSWSVFGEP